MTLGQMQKVWRGEGWGVGMGYPSPPGQEYDKGAKPPPPQNLIFLLKWRFGEF